MSRLLTEQMLLQASEYIEKNFALNFPKDRWNDLERSIGNAAKELGYSDVELFVRHLTSASLTRGQVEILIPQLTVNETYFWREPGTFDALVHDILPELVRLRQEEKRIRLWSAGCATGEEPYSLAIALQSVIPQLENWNITILATDISPQSLRHAAAGVYDERSFRNSPPGLKEKFFSVTSDGLMVISPAVKRMVTFAYLNLADTVYPSLLNDTNAMDIIFCRNVLIYFTPQRCRQVMNGLFNAIVPGGHLVVSASELSLRSLSDFTAVNYPDCVVYQKKMPSVIEYRTMSVAEPAPQFVVNAQLPDPVISNTKNSIPRHVRKTTDNHRFSEMSAHGQTVHETAVAYYKQGKYSRVAEVLQKEQQTQAEQMLLIRAYANQGMIDKAAEICEKAVMSDKLNPALYYLYATILLEQHRSEEAGVSLKRAIYLDPNFVLAHYSLGKIYQSLGNVSSADKCTEHVMAILQTYGKDDILFESEGLTAGRFKEMIHAARV